MGTDVRRYDTRDSRGRLSRITSAICGTLHDVTLGYPTLGSHVVLVLLDARNADSADLLGMARTALRAGAQYACSWGPDCERLESAFDRVRTDEQLEVDDDPDDAIVTTSHASESLEQAVDWLLDDARPAPSRPATRDGVIVIVGGGAWAEAVHERLLQRKFHPQGSARR